MRYDTGHSLGLRDLSRDLVRDFLPGDDFGVRLPTQIVLYGCPRDVLILMKYLMKKELAERNGVSISVRRHASTAFRLTNNCYYIDLGYFVGHPLQPMVSAPASKDCKS